MASYGYYKRIKLIKSLLNLNIYSAGSISTSSHMVARIIEGNLSDFTSFLSPSSIVALLLENPSLTLVKREVGVFLLKSHICKFLGH